MQIKYKVYRHYAYHRDTINTSYDNLWLIAMNKRNLLSFQNPLMSYHFIDCTLKNDSWLTRRKLTIQGN